MQQNIPWLRLAPLLILLLIAIVLALGLGGKKPTDDGNKLVGMQLTPFALPTIDNQGNLFTPAAWHDRVAVLNVFASWCEPCAAEHPVLMKLASSGKVSVYGIAWKDKEEKVIEWINARGNPYQLIGLDDNGRTTVALALSGVPETFVIDRTGTIRYRLNSPLTDTVVDTIILPLVDQLNQGNAR